jgi:hypothetical protein
MTKEQAEKFLPVLEAFAKGEKVQYLEGNWKEVETVDLQKNPEKYRIKPKGVEIRVALFKSKLTKTPFSRSYENLDGIHKDNVEKDATFVRWLYVEEVYE